MIETIIPTLDRAHFLCEQVDSVLISDSPIVLDLFYLEDINGLVLKNFDCFTQKPDRSSQDYVEILGNKDHGKFEELGFTPQFTEILVELLGGLSTTLLGVQVTEPKKEMCPSVHVDKLPLRLVQCIDEVGTTLITGNGTQIETEKNDLIFLKGEMWKSNVGALRHRSPATSNLRSLLRVDFLD